MPLLSLLSLSLQDYNQFHAPRIIFFDDNQTFSPQYDLQADVLFKVAQRYCGLC
jgi:hypothetical protein